MSPTPGISCKSHLYLDPWAGAVVAPMFQMQRLRQGCIPHSACTKGTQLRASLPVLGWWEMRQPQTPRSHPRWSFLYSHHGLSVSVALMRRPRRGELIKATSSHQRLPGDGTSKFSLRRSFPGGALISDKVREQQGPSPSQ